MKDKVKQILAKRPLKRKEPEKSLEQAIQGIPRITNETVAEHREEVLSSARKYIYPLQHSEHKVVIISLSLLIVVVIAFFTYCLLALYKFQSTSTFVYRITQVVPFPVAKAGPRFVSYENYLFELRHYIHYSINQQRIDTSSEAWRQEITAFRKRAMQRVIDYAYIKELAQKHKVSVSDSELDDAVALVRSQNRLGSSDQVFADVLKEFWGWSVADFRRELKQQMLAQKVVATLDATTKKRADEVYARLQQGEDFAALAKQYSDDTNTREGGGEFGMAVSQTDRDLPPKLVDTLFKLKVGETSQVVSTGTGLEIIKLNSVEGDKVRFSHILFTYKPVDTYVEPLRSKDKPKQFIGL
jgi:parvulin-like peptidyl-prolyl isomerase